MKKWTDNWIIHFCDWGGESGLRAEIHRYNNSATVYKGDNGKYKVAINYEYKREFNWPSEARKYAINCLSRRTTNKRTKTTKHQDTKTNSGDKK